MRRQFLGKVGSLMLRTRAYLASDAIEVDEIEGYTGTRRRVLLDEVQLITLDRRRSTTLAVSLVVTAAFFLIFLIAWLGSRDPATRAIMVAAGIVVAPFAAIAALKMTVGNDYVTVFGKRGVAQVAFFLRKKRARQVFALLQDRVQEAQARAGNVAQEPAPGGSASVA